MTTHLDPREAAADLTSNQDPAWVDAFCDALAENRRVTPLARVLEVWALTGSDAARVFGVSRQAVAQWLQRGAPSDRLVAIADLAAATDLLVHYLKRERIPAVVRRPASQLGDRSLLELAATGDSAGVLRACRAMFDYGATSG